MREQKEKIPAGERPKVLDLEILPPNIYRYFPASAKGSAQSRDW